MILQNASSCFDFVEISLLLKGTISCDMRWSIFIDLQELKSTHEIFMFALFTLGFFLLGCN